MSDTADTWPRNQRLLGMNDRVYDPVANPMGWNGEGHRTQMPRLGADLASLAVEVADNATIAAAAADQSGAWLSETATVAYVSATALRLTGVNRLAVALPGGQPGRAVYVRQGDGGPVVYGWVAGAIYDAGDTILVVKSATPLDATITDLHWGQDPCNAPRPQASSPLRAALFI